MPRRAQPFPYLTITILAAICIPVVLVQKATGQTTEGAIVTIAIFIALALFGRRALAKARRAQRRAALLVKYGSEKEADMILNKTIWTGMSADQLLDGLGRPGGVDQQITARKTREIWKYGRIGQNRYQNRITVEQGKVVGWTAKQS